MSASALFLAADILDVPITYFFDGYKKLDGTKPSEEAERQSLNDGGGRPAESACDLSIDGFLRQRQEAELSETFPLIASTKTRKRILDLVRSLADKDD